MAVTFETKTRPSARRAGGSPFMWGGPDRPKTWVRKVRSGLLALVVVAVAAGLLVPILLPIGLGADAVADAYEAVELPPPRKHALTSYLFDSNGHPLTSLHAEVDRTPIPLARMPRHLIQAILATEDASFYEHGGVSPSAIFRAAWANALRGQIWQGGSTLTEQYVKNAYGDPGRRTLLQKVEEAVLAMKLERELSKDQILERYLNTIYFGQGAYGIFAAAKTYFSKEPIELTLLESATLVGVISRPGVWNPVTNPPAALYRRDFVLDRMVEEGFLTAERAAVLKERPLGLHLFRGKQVPAAYFVTEAKKWLERKFGVEATFSGGLQVTTTLDMEMQKVAEAAVSKWLPGSETTPSTALVAMDPRTGAVRAMVGDSRHLGRWKMGRFNLATDAKRQTGSAFKTFTLVAAMEDRISLNSVWEGPSQIEIPDEMCQTRNPDTGVDENWTPVNAGDGGYGRMTLGAATVNSVNTIFAQLIVEVGPADVAEVARRMGIQTPLQPICSLTLGGEDVTVLDMTTAYATLASRGIRHTPRFVAEVRDRRGRTLAAPSTRGERALDQNDADVVTYTLERVINEGTGYRARLSRPAAGKTGSGEKNTNAYFCGYIPQLVACVWVGFPTGLVPMDDDFFGGAVYGGTFPALIWHDFMAAATQGMEVEDFATPSFDRYDVFPEGTGIPVSEPSSPEPEPSPEPTRTRTPSPEPTRTRTPTPDPTTPEPTDPTTTEPVPSEGSPVATVAVRAGGGALLGLGLLAPFVAGGLRYSRGARRARRSR